MIFVVLVTICAMVGLVLHRRSSSWPALKVRGSARMPSSHLSVQGLVNSQSNHSNGGFVESNKSQDRVISEQDFEEIDLSRGDDRGVHAETMRHQANHFRQSYPYVVLDDAYMPTYSHYNLQYSEK